MIDQQIDIPTKDGKTTTFISHPERGGPFPVILFYMDAPGIREELRDMARRLATSGYYVMLPNMYYRAGAMELGPVNPDPESPERKRMFELMHSLTIPLVMEDTKALLAYAETQKAANTGIVGTVGYCMSGRYAVNAATHFPAVKAAASMYGVSLATDQPDSPHLAAPKTKAELYFGCAETDVYAPMEVIEKVKAGMAGSIPARITALPSPSARSITATRRNGIGSGSWRSTAATSRYDLLFEHDLFGKPVSTFPDHALAQKD
jgi:carboxymethylenebutenolidase